MVTQPVRDRPGMELRALLETTSPSSGVSAGALAQRTAAFLQEIDSHETLADLFLDSPWYFHWESRETC